MGKKSHQGATLIQLAVLFNIVVNSTSEVEHCFNHDSKLFCPEVESDGVYQYEYTHGDTHVYTQVSAAIPFKEAQTAVKHHLSSDESHDELVQQIIKSDLATQARNLTERKRDGSVSRKFLEAFVTVNGEIGALMGKQFNWFPQNQAGAQIHLRTVAGVPKTNLHEEFEKAHSIQGQITKEEMSRKFGNIYGEGDFKHEVHHG